MNRIRAYYYLPQTISGKLASIKPLSLRVSESLVSLLPSSVPTTMRAQSLRSGINNCVEYQAATTGIRTAYGSLSPTYHDEAISECLGIIS